MKNVMIIKQTFMRYTTYYILLSQIKNTGNVKVNTSPDYVQREDKNQPMLLIILAFLRTFG